MIEKAIFFASGILFLWLQTVPPPAWMLLVIALILPGLAVHRFRLTAVFVLGFLWAALHCLLLTGQGAVVEQLRGKTVLLEGMVRDTPAREDARRIRFLFQAERLHDGDDWQPFRTRVRLDWYGQHAQPLAGERWQLAVRLKEPHGFANPGGFDYELWLFRQRIRATGYVRTDHRNRRIDAGQPHTVNVLRARLASATEGLVETRPAMALIQALTVGQREQISTTQWQTLRATGTSHLMAISGLHISLVAGLMFAGVRFAWSCSPGLSRRLPAVRIAAAASILAALLYALLSGFAVPAQRALVMVTVFMLALMAGRRTTFPAVIAIAAVATLLIDPLSVLSAGWWLSFWAVGAIAWFITGRQGRRSRWRRWVLLPVVLAVCMTPVLLLFFQQVSLIAPLANIVAIPWVSFLVIPLALGGTALYCVSELAGLFVLEISGRLLALLWQLLEQFAAISLFLLDWPQPDIWILVAATAGVALLFMPRGVPGRWCGALLLLPLAFVTRPQPGAGEVWLTLLDVGQGLAAVVRTARHVLVYDTGPAFSEDFDTGRAVVAPYLRYLGIRHIDRLIISHGDNDHIGGARSVLRQYPDTAVITSVPDRLSDVNPAPCRSGMRWQWDGVVFEILHPAGDEGFSGNDASCVLRVGAVDGQQLLLPGDIESGGERALLQRYSSDLAASVLVVPHHGSKTSSSAAFIRAVSPSTALVPAGYRNRYGFPWPDVVSRYKSAGSNVIMTGDSGAITVKLSPHSGQPRISRYRQVRLRLWRRRDEQ